MHTIMSLTTVAFRMGVKAGVNLMREEPLSKSVIGLIGGV
jgi:hypothetical protein